MGLQSRPLETLILSARERDWKKGNGRFDDSESEAAEKISSSWLDSSLFLLRSVGKLDVRWRVIEDDGVDGSLGETDGIGFAVVISKKIERRVWR
ncbi:MAG: hypothetical protein M1836_001699 [Candelina mexicana]|nr:MAG: hypothetical protein M1836_001699 [Candelina mexicana]